MDLKKVILETLADSIDLKKMALGLVDNVIEEALKELIADSANTFDDMAMAALWPVLEEKLKEVIEAELDLKKILQIEAKEV